MTNHNDKAALKFMRDYTFSQAIAKLVQLQELEALGECFEYFDNKADADYCDEDGFIPNEEMKLFSEVEQAHAALKEWVDLIPSDLKSELDHYKKHHYNHISTEETLMDAAKHLLEGVGDE